MNVPEKIQLIREAFESGLTKNVGFRRKQLKSLVRLYEENEDRIIRAVRADMKRPRCELLVSELFLLKEDALNVLRNFKSWIKDEKTGKNLVNLLDDVFIRKEPYGVVLIIGTWNYPMQMALMPLAGAIAAGNCCVLKPSELAPNVSKLIAELVSVYLDDRCYFVCEGGVDVGKGLLKERFDYIFFTGSRRVGRIVHRAANEFLTPVALELGGKCPVFVDSDSGVCLTSVAEKIVWGKFYNAGQTCICPDYVLCKTEIEGKFVEACRKALYKFYGRHPEDSPDFGRIINPQHYRRILRLINRNNIVLGGNFNPSDNYISPTIITNVRETDLIMQEEIFGPVLPIINIKNHLEAIEFINSRDKPLAMYIFSNSDKLIELFLNQTSSGGVTINDTLSHFLVDELPFGGVGGSGTGAYHGKHTFELFTHRKSVLKKRLNFLNDTLLTIRNPPYSEKKLQLFLFILKKRSFRFIRFLRIFNKYLGVFILGYLFAKMF